MLFSKLLKTKFFWQNKTLPELYSEKSTINSYYPSKVSSFHRMSTDSFIATNVILSIIALFSGAFGLTAVLVMSAPFVIFNVGYQIFLYNEYIKHFFAKTINNLAVNSFEKKYIYNTDNFVQLMNEINFSSVEEFRKKRLLNNIAQENFDKDDATIVYNLLIETQTQSLENRLAGASQVPTKKTEVEDKDISFFTKNQ